MSGKRRGSVEAPPRPVVPKRKSLEVIGRMLRELDDLRGDPALARAWQERGKAHFRQMYGEDSQPYVDLIRLNFEAQQLFDVLTEREQVLVFQSGLAEARNLLAACREEIETWATGDEEPVASSPSDAVAMALRVCERFHRAALRLRERYGTRAPLLMGDEHDVQYLLGALLGIHFDDIEPEDYTPKYAGGGSRIDFVLRPERIAIETKMTRPSLRDREIGEELTIDIARYEAHGGVDTLICLVHDPERLIRNARGLESDLERRSTGRLAVRILVRG